MDNNQEINIKEGTITFWVKENSIDWDDNQITVFVNYSNPKGSIFIIKDDDNKLKFSM